LCTGSHPEKNCKFCPYCDETYRTSQGLRSHIEQSKVCHERRYTAYAAESDDDLDSESSDDEAGLEESSTADRDIILGVEEPVAMDSYWSDDDDAPHLSADPPQSNDSPIGLPSNLPATESEPVSHMRKRQRATVEEVEDEDERYVQDFPAELEAGKVLDECKTYFQAMRDKQKAAGNPPWHPFESEDEWELAQWLMTSGISQKKRDDYLKLKAVRTVSSIIILRAHRFVPGPRASETVLYE